MSQQFLEANQTIKIVNKIMKAVNISLCIKTFIAKRGQKQKFQHKKQLLYVKPFQPFEIIPIGQQGNKLTININFLNTFSISNSSV